MTLLPKSLRHPLTALGLTSVLVIALGLAACASEAPVSASSPGVVAQTPLEQTQAAFQAAAGALQARDGVAYRAALPTRGAAAGEAMSDFYRSLSPLSWVSFSFVVTQIPGYEGRYLVQASGELKGVGPRDRLAGERVVEAETDAGGVTVVGDQTPPLVRRQYLMAFTDPLEVRRHGLVVIGESRTRAWLQSVADAGAEARRMVHRLRVDAGGGVLVAVYASGAQMRAAFADGLTEKRMRFFAHVTPRVGAAPWSRYDIAVLGPQLAALGGSTERLLAHELTHAYTVGWFLETEHAPTLLLEGLAEAVDGLSDGDYAALREEVSTGNHLWPLTEALATGSLWAGNEYRQIGLAYTIAESLVLYVLHDWGLQKLRPFCRAVADSDLSEEGLDRATREVLGVGWERFQAGWARYVLSSS